MQRSTAFSEQQGQLVGITARTENKAEELVLLQSRIANQWQGKVWSLTVKKPQSHEDFNSVAWATSDLLLHSWYTESKSRDTSKSLLPKLLPTEVFCALRMKAAAKTHALSYGPRIQTANQQLPSSASLQHNHFGPWCFICWSCDPSHSWSIDLIEFQQPL